MSDDGSAWVAFAGSLLGGAIGVPIGYLLQEKIRYRAKWRERVENLVSDVRICLSYIEAFWEIKDNVHGDIATLIEERRLISRELLISFDLKPLKDAVNRLSELGPGESSQSAAAQWLISHLLILIAHMEQIVKSIDRQNPTLLEEADALKEDIGIFLTSVYPKRLGINHNVSFIYDSEISAFEHAIAQNKIKKHNKKAEDALNKVRESYKKANP